MYVGYVTCFSDDMVDDCMCHYCDQANGTKDTKVPVATARMTFSMNRLKTHIWQKKHAWRRSHGNIHPPNKNVISTVGVKSISEMCFPRCTRSIKNSFLTEHGKHNFDFCDPSKVKRSLFFSLYTIEGCKKMKIAFLRSMRSKKNTLLTEHKKQIFNFCNPSRVFWPILVNSKWF